MVLAMDQLVAVPVAFRLASELLRRTNPGLALVPRAKLNDLLPLKTSVAVPLRAKLSTVLGATAATYATVRPVALKEPPASDQVVDPVLADAFRLVSLPLWMTRPGLAVVPSVRLSCLLSLPKVSAADPLTVNFSGVALVPVVAAT